MDVVAEVIHQKRCFGGMEKSMKQKSNMIFLIASILIVLMNQAIYRHPKNKKR